MPEDRRNYGVLNCIMFEQIPPVAESRLVIPLGICRLSNPLAYSDLLHRDRDIPIQRNVEGFVMDLKFQSVIIEIF